MYKDISLLLISEFIIIVIYFIYSFDGKILN